MNARQLRYFLCVANAGSITQASKILHIAQPALSNQISQLEEDSGVTLFVRHSRGVNLTPAGEFLVTRAEDILRLLDETTASLRNFRAATRLDTKLGLPTTTTATLALPLMSAIERHLPAVNLQIVEGMTGHILNWLEQQDLHLGVLFSAPEKQNFWVRHIGYESLYLIGQATDELRDLSTLTFADAAQLPIVHSTSAHQLRRRLDSLAARIAQPLNYISEIDSLAQIRLLVREGRGFTILPGHAVADWTGPEIRAWKIQLPREISEKDGDFGICLVATQEFVSHQYAEQLLAIIEETLRALINTGSWVGVESA